MDECIFCKIVGGEVQSIKIYEDSMVIAFLDVEPINEGHVLLIPRDHYLDADEMPIEILIHLTEISQKLISAIKKTYRSPGYSIMQNGGIFNDIGHYHMHIFPRYEDDKFSWTSDTKYHDFNQNIADKIRINMPF